MAQDFRVKLLIEVAQNKSITSENRGGELAAVASQLCQWVMDKVWLAKVWLLLQSLFRKQQPLWEYQGYKMLGGQNKGWACGNRREPSSKATR